MSIKAQITASMCTNEIRALAAAAVDKVNGTVVPKSQNTGCMWVHLIHKACYFHGVFILLINGRPGLHLNIT